MEWVAFPRRHERRPSFHPRQEKTGKGNNSTKGRNKLCPSCRWMRVHILS